jgi:hypothetical protein
LGVAAHIPLHANDIPLYYATIFFLAVGLCDFIAAQRAGVMATIIARRWMVTSVVFFVSMLAGAYLVKSLQPADFWHKKAELFQFMLQGALVGVIVRLLIVAMLEYLISGSPIESTRALLLTALTVLIWLCPLGATHRAYAGFYIFGFGVGFLIHYLVRNKEHKQAEEGRLGRYVIELLGSKATTGEENKIVRHYGAGNWFRLDRLLRKYEEKSTLVETIRAARLRYKGKYSESKGIAQRELERPEHDNKDNAALYLHLALSLADEADENKKQMFEALEKARASSDDSVLALVTTALRLAEDIPLNGTTDANGQVNKAREAEYALRTIWKAMGAADTSPPELIATIVGTTVPMTWTFFLDAYAYVLLKAGYIRFSRSLLAQCIYEDPYFSTPYLHLGEWCIADILRSRRELQQDSNLGFNANRAWREALEATSERSQRVGRLCLHIAIKLERYRNSLTKRRAKALLKQFDYILFESH